MHHLILVTLIFLLHEQCKAKEQEVTKIYSNITDCSDRTMSEFYASITPNPLFVVEPINIWFGGEISFTRAAQQIANVTYDCFNQNLRTIFFIDNTSFIFPDFLLKKLQPFNNTISSELIDETLVIMMRNAIVNAVQNSPIFAGVGIDAETGNAIYRQIIQYFLQKIGALTPMYIQIRVKLIFRGHELLCIRANWRTEKDNSAEPTDLAKENYAMVFQTSKYANREGKLVCPPNSTSLSNNEATCRCNGNHSGPFCRFQCTKEEIDAPLTGFCRDTGTTCNFTVADYTDLCINYYDKPVLNGLIQIDMYDVHTLILTWEATNFTTFYQYIVTISSDDGNKTTSLDHTFYCEGIPYRAAVLFMQVDDYGLQLSTFTNYTVVLEFVTTTVNSSRTSVTIASSTNYTTPEGVPQQVPQITAVKLRKNQVVIGWKLPGKCPGIIRYYNVEILCDKIANDTQRRPGNSGNISVDCRSDTDGTQLIAGVPVQCQESNNMQVRLRVGTVMGISNWSIPFEIADSSWPPAVIVVVGLGAFIIAVLLAALGFYYYYKRHVQTYQGVYNTLRGLLTIRRAGGIGQSFRDLDPQDRRFMPMPDLPLAINADSQETTKFEPTPQSQSPCSPAYPDNNILSDPMNRPNSGISPAYASAILHE